MNTLSATGKWFAAALLCGTLASPLGAQGAPDFIFHDGKILTVDSNFSTAQAVAVTGNKFSAVGNNADVLKLAGPNTKAVDLKGRTVIPGLIDTHIHLHNYAESAYGADLGPEDTHRYLVDWRGVTSKQDVLNQLKNLAGKYKFPSGRWIYFENQLTFTGGRGSVEHAKILYDQMNRYDLDPIFPNNPIVLSLGIPDFNGFLLNSAAIDTLWNKMGYADFIKKYGRYWIDASGQPEGHIEPPASRLVGGFVLDRDPAVLAPLYKKYIDELISAGMTTVSTRMPQETIEAFQLLESQGQLALRTGYGREAVFGTLQDPAKDLKEFQGIAGRGTDVFWVTSVAPTAVDGATTRACTNQERKSAFGPIDGWWPLGQCHTDAEFVGAAGKGAPISGNYFRDWTISSGSNGVRFANTHVAGDRSVENLLGMFEFVQKQLGESATRGWAMDHCFLIDPSSFAKAARLNVAFSCAPKYVEGAPGVARSYGEQVANTFMVPVKSMLAAGIHVSYESDRDIYPWHDLEILLTRKDRNGKVWGEHEKVDKATALKMATTWAADYVLKPDKIGSIEVGKLADLAVLDRDYLTIPAEEVSELRSELTLMDGKITYLYPDFAREHSLNSPGAVVASYKDLIARRNSEERPDF